MKYKTTSRLEGGLVIAHAALAAASAYQTAELDALLGGLFSTWWTNSVLLIPAAISVPMVVRWLLRKPVAGLLVAATAYWLFATAGYIASLLQGGEMISGHAIGVTGGLAAAASLWHIVQRSAVGRFPEPRH